MLILDNRLAAVERLVDGVGTVCDVGTDHAYLVAHLLLNERCKTAIAADINDGPLAAAAETLRKYGVFERAAVVKSDGLAEISAEGISDVVIAGMGAELICQIISKAEWLKNGVNLVLQPMTRAYFLRKWLYENGFEIVEEDVAECENRLYSVVKARYIGEFSGVDDVFERLGKIDLSKSLGQKYAKNQAKILEKVGNGLKNSRENLEKSMSKLSTAEKIRQKLEEHYD